MNMDLCERLGLNKDSYSVSIPLGATINMDGAAVTITVMSLAAAHTLGISVDIPTAVILSVLGNSICMRSFRSCRWISAFDSSGMFSLWHSK